MNKLVLEAKMHFKVIENSVIVECDTSFLNILSGTGETKSFIFIFLRVLLYKLHTD